MHIESESSSCKFYFRQKKKNILLILFKRRIERHHCESKVQVFGEYLEIKYTIPIIFYSTAKSKEPFEELNIEEAKLNKLEYIMHNTEVNILIVNTRINFTNEQINNIQSAKYKLQTEIF